MPDEHSEELVKVLGEIRDLLKAGYKLSLQKHQDALRRYEEGLERQEQARARAFKERRRFFWTLVVLLVLTLACFAFVFWAMPRAERKQTEEQMEIEREMRSNYWSQPH